MKAKHKKLSMGSSLVDAYQWVPSALIDGVQLKKDAMGNANPNIAFIDTNDGKRVFLSKGDWIVFYHEKQRMIISENEIDKKFGPVPAFLCGVPAFIDDNFIRIKFQAGNVMEGHDINGTTIADAIQKIINKLKELQKSKFPDRFNAKTINLLEMAVEQQKDRTADRKKRNVEGKAAP